MGSDHYSSILDPYDWLPEYGESRVSFHSVGSDVILDIEYEKEVVVDSEEVVLALRREVKFRKMGSDNYSSDGSLNVV